MSKKANKSIWMCSECGNEHSTWAGKCSFCGGWNTLKEIKTQDELSLTKQTISTPILLTQIKTAKKQRLQSNIEEFDLVSGGGIVQGSVTLIGGQPGVGKSTLVWQIASNIKDKVIYIAGEESAEQIKIRADRLTLPFENISIVEDQDINAWLPLLDREKPSLVIIDSIQTVYDSALPSNPGSLIQVKASAMKIIKYAKKLNIAVILIGHVTKDGEVAGPKILEHLVDAVFYLDGEKGGSGRFLRSQKNRFGPTDELGVFDITSKGLKTSAEFGRISPLKSLPIGVSRSAVLEGSRVCFIEVQALVTKSNFAMARRNAVGYDFNRLQMMVAILSKHTKIDLNSHDVFLNISDGYKLKDPIADLSVLMALTSSYLSKPTLGENIFIGEVDLAGRLHLPEYSKRIIKASVKMGFKCIYSDQLIRSLIEETF